MVNSHLRQRRHAEEKNRPKTNDPTVDSYQDMIPFSCQSAAAVLLISLFVLYQFSPETHLTPSLPVFSRIPELAATGQSLQEGLNADYVNRLNAALAQGRSPPARVFLRWLHIPKTGTSFVNTLIRWGCPNAPRDIFIIPKKERPDKLDLPLKETFSWDWLFSNETGREWIRRFCKDRLVTARPGSIDPYYSLHMHRALKKWEWPNAIALFRLPLQRVYSNYLHLSRHYNETRPSREPLQTFLQRSQFWGQQAKLLLGRHYRDDRILTHDDALHAALIVSKLRFVGLTEHFELSSRLFHAKFGGVPHRVQFENVRPSITRYRSSQTVQSTFRYDERVFKGWTDQADDIVYKAAERRFWRDVAELKDQIEQDGLGPITLKYSPS